MEPRRAQAAALAGGDPHLGDRLAGRRPDDEVVLQALGGPLQGGGDTAQVRRAARPGQPRDFVSAQIADGQLPDAVGQDHRAQARDRGLVKPHS